MKEVKQLFVNYGQGCLSIVLISAFLPDVFALQVPASASDVRWNETRLLVTEIPESVGALTRASQACDFHFKAIFFYHYNSI